MLKLERIEGTNIFAIVEVEGFVRIQENSDEKSIKKLGKRTDAWLKEVECLIEEKRKELYFAKNISLKAILYYYFKTSKINYIFFDEIRNLVSFIAEELMKKDLMDKYNIPLELSQEKLEQFARDNDNAFCLSIGKDILSLKLTWTEMYNSYELLMIDVTIAQIIKKYLKIKG